MHRRKKHHGVVVVPHIAWYVIGAALLVVPILLVHAVITWQAMFGSAVPPARAVSVSSNTAVPSGNAPVMLRGR